MSVGRFTESVPRDEPSTMPMRMPADLPWIHPVCRFVREMNTTGSGDTFHVSPGCHQTRKEKSDRAPLSLAAPLAHFSHRTISRAAWCFANQFLLAGMLMMPSG